MEHVIQFPKSLELQLQHQPHRARAFDLVQRIQAAPLAAAAQPAIQRLGQVAELGMRASLSLRQSVGRDNADRSQSPSSVAAFVWQLQTDQVP